MLLKVSDFLTFAEGAYTIQLYSDIGAVALESYAYGGPEISYALKTATKQGDDFILSYTLPAGVVRDFVYASKMVEINKKKLQKTTATVVEVGYEIALTFATEGLGNALKGFRLMKFIDETFGLVKSTGISYKPLSIIDDTVRITVPENPSVYTSAFEMKLDPVDIGRSRRVHFNRANSALETQMLNDPEFALQMEQLSKGVLERTSSTGGRKNPVGWTWEHVSTDQATGYEIGYLRLVPSEQHTPGSPWWRVIHRNKGAAGGYSEWAIPAGAPLNK